MYISPVFVAVSMIAIGISVIVKAKHTWKHYETLKKRDYFQSAARITAMEKRIYALEKECVSLEREQMSVEQEIASANEEKGRLTRNEAKIRGAGRKGFALADLLEAVGADGAGRLKDSLVSVYRSALHRDYR